MSAADHRRWEEDVAAHALGALDGDETVALEAHLDGCEACRAELDRLRSTVDLLPTSVEQLVPPASLRRDLMATVEAEAARDGGARGSSAGGRFRLPRLRTLSAAAGACALAIALVVGLSSGGDDPERSETVAVEALAPAEDVSAAMVREGDSWTLDVERLPRIPAGSVYQVWVRSDRGLRPSSAFVLSGDRSATVPVPERLDDGDQVLVTREARRGNAEPTTAPLLQARI